VNYGVLTTRTDQLGLKFDFLDIPYTVNPISDNLHPHHWMNRMSAVSFDAPKVLGAERSSFTRQHHPCGAPRPAQQDLARYDNDLFLG
jgi:hypothetical protein